jgi:hypothetical protein
MTTWIHFFAASLAAALAAIPAHAEMSTEELAKLAQNPIGNLISLPFQNNTNLNAGPQNETQNILNIQPVIPIEVNSEWNIITRTIIPVISQPPLTPTGGERINGIGDVQFSAFLSPASPGSGGLIWGAGAIAQAPTDSNDALGNPRWGLGPTVVVLHLEHDDPWVYGVLVNQIWSVGNATKGSRQQGDYSQALVQPFVNYNLPDAKGTYLTSSPIITADWKADSGQKYTVPVGGGIGHIFHLGKLPVNTQLAAYYNAVKPDFGPNWQIRFQVQLMFPK